MPRMVSLRKRFAELIPELAKFGVVGLIGSVIDLGGAAYLHGAVGVGPMVAKGLSIIAATVVTYFGSRFWTFRHRVNQALLREGTLFVALNIVGLAIAECVIAIVTYGLDMKGALAYNAASVRRHRARHDLPVLLVQEVGVPGRCPWSRGGRRGSRGIRDRRRRGYQRGGGAADPGVAWDRVQAAVGDPRPGRRPRPRRRPAPLGLAPLGLAPLGLAPLGLALLGLLGRKTAKVAGSALTSTTRPPSAAAIVRASAKPSPVPSGRPLTLRSKMRDTSSGGTPLPSSLTSITTERALCEVCRVTVPPPCMSALSSRVAST